MVNEMHNTTNISQSKTQTPDPAEWRSPAGLSYQQVMAKYDNKIVTIKNSTGKKPTLFHRNAILYRTITGCSPANLTKDQLSFLMNVFKSEHRFIGKTPTR
jgi:hypothetical protein